MSLSFFEIWLSFLKDIWCKYLYIISFFLPSLIFIIFRLQHFGIHLVNLLLAENFSWNTYLFSFHLQSYLVVHFLFMFHIAPKLPYQGSNGVIKNKLSVPPPPPPSVSSWQKSTETVSLHKCSVSIHIHVLYMRQPIVDSLRSKHNVHTVIMVNALFLI